ncbi:hypothetical protein GOV07_01110 [Candidatus Woesearchaeota archaeon]|nr:hypothetical protein [Candidatus Woesearchaeota archaeon]
MRIFGIILLCVLLSACAEPMDFSENLVPTAGAKTSVNLDEGRNVITDVGGKAIKLKLESVNGDEATVSIDEQQTTLSLNQPVQVSGFTVTLDEVVAGGGEDPNYPANRADITYSGPGQPGVRDFINEGTGREFVYTDGSSKTVLLTAMGQTGKRGVTAWFSVDGEEKTLGDKDDGYFSDGSYIYVHGLYYRDRKAPDTSAKVRVTVST